MRWRPMRPIPWPSQSQISSRSGKTSGILPERKPPPEQQANADSVYNVVKYGASTGTEGWIPAPTCPSSGGGRLLLPHWGGLGEPGHLGFGYRRDPFTGETQGHTGMDLAVPTGTPVRAALPGTVTAAQYHSGYGYYVMIDHGNGLFHSLRPQLSTAGAGGPNSGGRRHRISVRQAPAITGPPPPLRGAGQRTENKPQIPANHIIRGVREYELNPEYGLPYCRL